MNKYESVVIINPSLEGEAIKALISKFSDLINTNGKVDSVEELGNKKLAYEIKKFKSGYYFLFVVEATKEAIDEFDHVVRINENLLRHLVVKKENN